MSCWCISTRLVDAGNDVVARDHPRAHGARRCACGRLVFKTTAPGHTPPAAKERLRPATTERPPAPHADLSEAERTEIERQVAPIEDQKLREALENAMRASAEWAKGVQSKKEP